MDKIRLKSWRFGWCGMLHRKTGKLTFRAKYPKRVSALRPTKDLTKDGVLDEAQVDVPL